MKAAIVLVSILAAFLGGFVPLYLKNRDIERKLEGYQAKVEEGQEQLSELEKRLRVAALRGELGMMLIDVQQNDFNSAKARSTKFFNDLRREAFEKKKPPFHRVQ